MTDERLGNDLWRALAALPRGGGVVFRHYATPQDQRRHILGRVRRIARARGLVVIVAGKMRAYRVGGRHHAGLRRTGGWRTASVHDVMQARAARRRKVDLVFLSPVFATRSHPDAHPLGPRRAAALARIAGGPAIALGGMNAARFATLPKGFHGWAAIDAWAAPRRDQKRKAVPI